jgi:HemY protein
MARAETLAKISSWHPEARLAMAQAAYEAREFGQAREALAPLLADRPTVRACLTMARIEEAEHGSGSGRAREWLSRAAHAPRDPLWIADGIASETWAPVSPVSGRLDAFVWKTPTELIAGPEAPDDTEETAPEGALAGPMTAPAPATTAMPMPSAPSKADGAAEPKPTTVLFPSTAKETAPVAAGMAAAAAPSAAGSTSPATAAGPLVAKSPTPVVFPPPKAGEGTQPRRAG